MTGKTRFTDALAASAAGLILLSLLLPAGSSPAGGGSRPGPLIAAALSQPAKQGDDIEINSVLESFKKCGLVSRASVTDGNKRIIADTEADWVGSILKETPSLREAETLELPGGNGGYKLLLYHPARKNSPFPISRFCGYAGLALLAASLLYNFAAGKKTSGSLNVPERTLDWKLLVNILKRSHSQERFVVLDSAGVIVASGPRTAEPDLAGKRLFESVQKNEILKSSENRENVIDADGRKFIFY